MATCAPTAWARAPTLLNWLQSSLAHTTKERRVPTVGGLARGVDAATAGARRAVAAGNRTARPRARSMPSNSVAAARRDSGSTRRCASGMAAAISVAVRRLKGAVWPNVAAADCGTSRYSAESTEALAGNVTHPPSVAGSIDAYAPTASVSFDARAELHVGALGPVASLLHAAVTASAHVTMRAAVRCFIPTSALASRDDSQAPMLTRTCTLRGLPNDAPLKNAPFSRYRWSNAFSRYTCGRTTIWPSAKA